MPNKYQHFSQIEETIDLHNLNGVNRSVTVNDVWNVIDAFIRSVTQKHASKLKKGFVIKIGIIVGKGTRTKNWINGKNPLRAYAEEYLDACGLNWRNGKFGEGEEGIIVVELN